MIAGGDAPDSVENHPAMKGIDLKIPVSPSAHHYWSLLSGADGSGLFKAGRARALPASTTGIPMTFMVGDKQYIVVATGARGVPAELVALTIP
jgi:quinoprotein glucose dehydrogenase